MNDFDSARQKLDVAIREFYDTILPGTYVEAWLLTVDRSQIDNTIPDATPDSINYQGSATLDSDWIKRRGIIEIAYQYEHDMQTIRALRDNGGS